LATEVARVLRGKHKVMFAPHIDTGDHVIVVNAAKVVLTANKGAQKFYYRHSGYPGGIRAQAYGDMLAKKPEEVVRLTVKGMLPKGPLGRQMLRKLKVCRARAPSCCSDPQTHGARPLSAPRSLTGGENGRAQAPIPDHRQAQSCHCTRPPAPG